MRNMYGSLKYLINEQEWINYFSQLLENFSSTFAIFVGRNFFISWKKRFLHLGAK